MSTRAKQANAACQAFGQGVTAARGGSLREGVLQSARGHRLAAGFFLPGRGRGRRSAEIG